jgi:DNA repair protein RadC
LNNLARLSVEQLCEYTGIGKAKAVSIVAALELGRRKDDMPIEERPALYSSKEVYKLMRSTYLDLQHEESWVLFVDSSLRLITKQMIGKGGQDFTPIDIRSVLRKGIECSARSLFLTHNHPSGTLEPSEADIALTERFVYAGAIMDIRITDHVIFTDKGYLSLMDEGIFDKFN